MTDQTAGDPIQQKSQQIQLAYAQLADISEAEATVRTLSAEEARFASSQYTMMWRRFRRNKAAIIGAVVVLTYYLVALFGNFVSPYTLTTRFTKYLFLPPQPVHLFDNGTFRPYVCGIDAEMDANLHRIYTPNCEEKYPIQFFSHGASYSVFGLFDTDLHLFTAGDGIISLLGTDRQGRDMFTRIVLGAQISLTVGLIGVMLSLFFGTVLGVASGYYGGLIDEVIQRVIELVRAFPSIPQH